MKRLTCFLVSTIAFNCAGCHAYSMRRSMDSVLASRYSDSLGRVNTMTSAHREYSDLIDSVEERVLSGGSISREEAYKLQNTPDEHVVRLAGAADRVRIHFKGYDFDACSLINARAGRCSEDCAFCAQSAH